MKKEFAHFENNIHTPKTCRILQVNDIRSHLKIKILVQDQGGAEF